MIKEQNKTTRRTTPRTDTNYIRVGIGLILLGGVFAVETYFNVHILYRLWPLILTAWGVGFIGIYVHRERREAAFLGLGIYSILFSFLSLYFSFVGWDALARLWPACVGFLAVTFLLIRLLHRKHKVYLLLGLFLASLTIIFFLVFYYRGDLWWTTFILVGLSILAIGRTR